MIGDPFHIIEIDERHRRNREERAALNDPTGTIRARIAMAAAKEEETKKLIAAGTAKIKSYLEYGYSRQDISQMLGIHPYIVDIEASRIEREEGEMDRIRPGWKRGGSGYFSIHQGLPTRR